MKNTILACAFLGLAGLGLASCGGSASDSGQAAAPEGIPGIKISGGRLVLPAVKGNPGVVYFTVDYTGDDSLMIRAAEVGGAKSAVLHSTSKGPNGETQMQETLGVKVEKGTPLKFEPGGNQVTLTFVGGSKMSFPATIEAAGSAR
jgi:copper(I)-binding protein